MPEVSNTDIAIIITHLEARRDEALAPYAPTSTKKANQTRLINKLINKLKSKSNDKK